MVVESIMLWRHAEETPTSYIATEVEGQDLEKNC